MRRLGSARSRLPAFGKCAEGACSDGEKAARLLSPPEFRRGGRGAGVIGPITDAEFAAALERLACFEPSPFLAVAVSGGADSLALAILADRWARSRGGSTCALSVDHRLRPESEAEILRLRGWLAARAIRHEVLVWAEPKPVAGIEAAARAARYRLLEGWCGAQGCLHLLTAHHREDQIETFAIRRRAGSGPDGLAAMSAVRELGDCRLLRPLLGFAKARLVALLEAEAQPYINDPSNRDPAFERSRLRAGAADPVDAGAVAAMIRACGRERVARQLRRDALLAGMASLDPAGFGLLDRGLLCAAPRAVAERALAAIATTLGGLRYPPRSARVAGLAAALRGAEPRARTLGGCRFVPWRGQVLVVRELAAAQRRIELPPGGRRLWDRRFRAELAANAEHGVVIGYLGETGGAELDRCTGRPHPARLPPLLHPILPAVWDPQGLAAVPALGYRREDTGVLPRLVLAPVNSLSGADFAVV